MGTSAVSSERVLRSYRPPSRAAPPSGAAARTVISRPTPAPSADDYERPPLPEEAPPAPPDLPPWEVPAPHRDKLDELVENAKQLDNFRIK